MYCKLLVTLTIIVGLGLPGGAFGARRHSNCATQVDGEKNHKAAALLFESLVGTHNLSSTDLTDFLSTDFKGLVGYNNKTKDGERYVYDRTGFLDYVEKYQAPQSQATYFMRHDIDLDLPPHQVLMMIDFYFNYVYTDEYEVAFKLDFDCDGKIRRLREMSSKEGRKKLQERLDKA